MRTTKKIGALGIAPFSSFGLGSDDVLEPASTAPADSAGDSGAPSSDAAPTSDAPDGSAPAAATEVGEGEGQVNLIAWAGYVEDGSTDAAVDWVTPFEEATGCQVNVKIGNSSDEMVQLMQTGEYDGVSGVRRRVRSDSSPAARSLRSTPISSRITRTCSTT